MRDLRSSVLFIALVCLVLPFTAHAATGQLRAGTAKVTITPENPGKPLHDECFARSLVLDAGGERIAFVAIDSGIYTSDELIASCKKKFGLSQLYLSSSHTHSGPGRGDGEFYVQQIMLALDTAVKNMYPARLSSGRRTFPQLGFNRLIIREDGHARESWYGDGHYRSENPDRIPFGPVDPEVGVIKITDMTGKPRAIIMNYACHSDVVCCNYAVSADFPGVACRLVEEAFDNLHCLFVQGAAGNVESLIISSRRVAPDDTFETDYSSIERVGQLLAYETITLAKSMDAGPQGDTDIRIMNDSLQFTGRFDTTAAFDIHISTLLINNSIVIATCPGELFAQLQLGWKASIKEAQPFVFGYTWFTGSWPNYIPDIESAARGGYGADQNQPVMIEVGSGESIMNKHLANYYRLSGLMRTEPGPTGFDLESRWIMQEVPRY